MNAKAKVERDEFCQQMLQVSKDIKEIKTKHQREKKKFMENSGLRLKKVWGNDNAKKRTLEEAVFKRNKTEFESDANDFRIAIEKARYKREQDFQILLKKQQDYNQRYGLNSDWGMQQIRDQFRDLVEEQEMDQVPKVPAD